MTRRDTGLRVGGVATSGQGGPREARVSGTEIADEVALLHLVELARAWADRVPHAVLLADLGRIRGDGGATAATRMAATRLRRWASARGQVIAYAEDEAGRGTLEAADWRGLGRWAHAELDALWLAREREAMAPPEPGQVIDRAALLADYRKEDGTTLSVDMVARLHGCGVEKARAILGPELRRALGSVPVEERVPPSARAEARRLVIEGERPFGVARALRCSYEGARRFARRVWVEVRQASRNAALGPRDAPPSNHTPGG